VSIPLPDAPAPPKVRELARGARLDPVWRNPLGGVTFRATDADGIRYIKFTPRTLEQNVDDEAARLAWAAPYTRVPVVRESGHDDTHEWLVTEGIDARSAVDPRWTADPATTVRELGRALRVLHDTLPVADCPFAWTVPVRIANAAARGIRVPEHLRTPPPDDLLVVCHGDACSPNTLIGDDGRWAGFVDLGSLGVGDRWADLASATLSAEWNYGPGWQEPLLAAYGIAPDPVRLAYYQSLWTET
jgi:kanamycin kinase